MSQTDPVILVVEDEAPIRKFLRAALSGEGYRQIDAETGEQGLRLATREHPDLMILDLGLPDMDGLEIIGRVREWSRLPIIVLSARGREGDKVAALDAGADDYLTKPFGVGELFARIRVALRHAARLGDQSSAEESRFSVGDLEVDLATRRVTVGGREVGLTKLEYRLLTTLVRHAGKVLTHRFLLKEVWGAQYVHETHYLRVFMANLRRKLEADPARPHYLLTEQGVGYRLAAD
jgi:two-component system KDP operon response regulator KdpE